MQRIFLFPPTATATEPSLASGETVLAADAARRVTEMLVITDAPIVASKPGFCAGITLWDDKVVGVADIVRYMRGWPRDKVCHYCAERGWTVTAPIAANDA